jgi:hypothetical protein
VQLHTAETRLWFLSVATNKEGKFKGKEIAGTFEFDQN